MKMTRMRDVSTRHSILAALYDRPLNKMRQWNISLQPKEREKMYQNQAITSLVLVHIELYFRVFRVKYLQVCKVA
jgi:hypothetical protein